MKITIFKSVRLLICTSGNTEILRAHIQLGFGADNGPKQREGDGRTPEGSYVVSTRNPASKFHLALGLSYPGPNDARRALASGIIDSGTCERICRNPQTGEEFVAPPTKKVKFKAFGNVTNYNFKYGR